MNHDEITVRLPSGSKATVFVPKVFTAEDGAHLTRWLALFLTDKHGEVLPLPPSASTTSNGDAPRRPLVGCAAGRDGDCTHPDCPQLRDNEPKATGRHCPLDTSSEED